MDKILIVDEHQVYRVGLRHLIETNSNFSVVYDCSLIKEAYEQTVRLNPDVVLMDIYLSDGNGIDACKRILSISPNTKVIILTSHTNDEEIFAAIMAGASGYLLKQISADDLVKAVEKVIRGESLLDPAITGKVIKKMKNLAQGEPSDELTVQEKRILNLLAEGKTNREIGESLALSENTIKNYVSGILSKCNLNNRAEAAVYAIKHLHKTS